MNKEYFNLLPYYTFYCDDSLLTEVLDEVRSLGTSQEKIKNQLNDILLNKPNCYYNEKLLDWLDQCLLEVKKSIGLYENLKLDIVACWANRSKKMQGHHLHSHPNSFLSGILYLTDHDSGYTHFLHKNYWFDNFQTYTISSINTLEEKIKPKAGKLVVFPSHLQHKVSGCVSKETRYTIAFNAFISGKLGSFSSDLDISVKTLREIVSKE